MTVTKPVLATLLVVFLVVGFTVGILIGIFAIDKPGHDHHNGDGGGSGGKSSAAAKARTSSDEDSDEVKDLLEDSFQLEPNYTALIKDENRGIKGSNIYEHLKFIASQSHVAGTQRNKEVGKYIYDQWKSFGTFDSVDFYDYDVLLSYSEEGNTVDVYNPANRDSNFISLAWKESSLQNNYIGFPFAYHAYAPSGNVTGELIFANFATDDDFEIIEGTGVNVSGKIVLARNGKIFRGNKVLNAARYGAVGVLLYPDASEVSAQRETEHSEEILESEALPKDGIQRGSIYEKIGDPLTPGYPSVDFAPRLDINEANLPDIISQPISTQDAETLLGMMTGTQYDNWGDYRLGPGFEGVYDKHKVTITSHNKLKTAEISNVIAKIEGHLEPDRYVIVGNNYDAWGLGAINPSSSTAQLLEIARIFGVLKKEGWQPRRTIIFAAWDAGKFGQIGSTEWVEQYLDILTSRAVAYINTESCIETDDIEVSASPILYQAVTDVAKMIKDEDSPDKTLYDDWLQKKKGKEEDMLTPLGAESDHAAFAFYAGIPSVDIHSQREDDDAHFYPKQNSIYDTIELFDAIDPERTRSVSCAQFTAVLIRYLADSAILPFNVKNMSDLLVKKYDEFEAQKLKKYFEERKIHTFDDLEKAIERFDQAAEDFHNLVDDIDDDNPLDIRMVNDQMMAVERAFINPEGDDDDWFHRHLLYGPTDLDKNADSVFYVFDELVQLIDDVESEESEEEREEKQNAEEPDSKYDIKVKDFWDENAEYIADVIMALDEAAKILKPLRGVYEDED